MKTYRIKLVSQTNIILLLFCLLIVLFILVATINLKSIAIPFTVGYFILAIFLWRKYVTGITIWTFTESGVKIEWVKKFFLTKTPDYFFPWKEIEKIWKGMDPNYYNLKFRFRSGNVITFYHDSGNDDFNELLPVLYNTWQEKSK